MGVPPNTTATAVRYRGLPCAATCAKLRIWKRATQLDWSMERAEDAEELDV